MNLLRDAFQVTTRTGGSYVNGKWVNETGGATSTVYGSCQFATPNEVRTLPEGRREGETRRLYTRTWLNSLRQNQNPDRVVVEGLTYEVFSRSVVARCGLSHYKYILTEVKS